MLDNENVKLKGELFNLPETITIKSGNQNKLFATYASEHPRREQTLTAWNFLYKIYLKDSLFSIHQTPKLAIDKEIDRITSEDELFLKKLEQRTYLSYYLPLRKLVSSVSTIAQHRPNEIPKTIKSLRSLNYKDERLYRSGLLNETIENHFWLIENSGNSLEEVQHEMKISIDAIFSDLTNDSYKLNIIGSAIFNLLEKRSMFDAAEYLSLKLLSDSNYKVNDDLKVELERYRNIKVGTQAPNFKFNGDVFTSHYTKRPHTLYDIKAQHTIIIFGSSWCPACPPDLMEIAQKYSAWKELGIEVVFISLDVDKNVFSNFVKPFPFISMSDYKKWKSPIVKAYFVNSTPRIFLLDDKKEIILRPNSVKHLEAWIDWYVIQGNK